MDESLSNKQVIKYALLILLIGVVIGSVSLTYPFGRDQGIYAYIGKLLREGKIQYKYAFDLKPPGVHYVFALAEMIFGESMFDIRVFDIFWQSSTAFVIFLIAFNFTRSRPAGFISSFLYLFLYYRLDYWHTLQADGFINLPFSLCVLMLIASRMNEVELKMIVAGIFFALTILFKYTVIIFLVLLVLWFLFNRKNSFNIRFKNLLLFITGFTFLICVTIAVYYLTGSTKQFFDVQFTQIPLYAGIGFDTESYSFILSQLFHMFFTSVYSPLIISCIFLFIILIRNKSLNDYSIILFIWIISSIINLVIQWKFFHYHYLAIIPGIAVGTTIFFSSIFNSYNKKYPFISNLAVITTVLFYLLFSYKPFIHNYQNLYNYVDGMKSLEQLYIENGITSDSAFMISNTFKAVNYVKNNTEVSDRIFIWGFDPVVYYLSGRECATKFIYNFPLYWKGNNEKFQKEFLEDINTNNPKLILVSQKDPLYYISGYHEDSKEMLKRFPEFEEFLNEKYIFRTQIDNFYYYELKMNL